MKLLSPLRRLLVPSSPAPRAELEEPIRAELFSIERMEEHAASLAKAQDVTREPRKGARLWPRVRENGRVLLASHVAISEAIRVERAITPAAEWLTDNWHVVEEQLREIRDDLPPAYYRELPKLASGHLQGYPRVYGLAWAFVAHTDSRFDPEVLRRFVNAYQKVQPLTIGELWAVPITLRVVLVENLRRLAEWVVGNRRAREDADELADGLLGLGGRSQAQAKASLRRYENMPMPVAFIVGLVQRLREQDPAHVPALEWLAERLRAHGTTADEIVRLEHQRQAAMNVTVRNVITSMRHVSRFDWLEFFESVSLVDELLRAGSGFGAMDFATRDRYRHAIEDLSRRSGRTELEVATVALSMAATAAAAESPQSAREREPGHYLISRGRLALEAAMGYRPRLPRVLLRWYVGAATRAYLWTIVAAVALVLAMPLVPAFIAGAGPAELLLFALLALIPASDLAVALVNRVLASLLGPRPLPRLELAGGVPKEMRTLIVVPTLLGSSGIEEQTERLEIHYLANPDAELRFALLTDWLDADAESVEGDERVLEAAATGIARLNERHGPTADGEERFALLHRRRTWCESERRWIGWERKRGKLHELNRLLRGAGDTTFMPVRGRAPSVPEGVRFVITLDADTRLPTGAARRLVGTLGHPLNKPRLDPVLGRVVEGYGVLQPRITPSLPADEERSIFRRAFAGPSGIDPYSGAVSDVYQDLFAEGSYTGKGIYDVDAFEAAMEGRVPESSLLSHDLFEGIFARAGLATDIEFFDDFPSNYRVAAVRSHRWARGDWQLLPWILGSGAGVRRTPIPAIGRWKMVDNLRRTLSAPAAWLLLTATLSLPAVSSAVWLRFILATLALPLLISFFSEMVPRRRGVAWRSWFGNVVSDLALATTQIAISITVLAHQAWLMGDAIGRTLVRIYVTRKNLLEWVPSAQASSSAALDLAGFHRWMAGSLWLAVVTGLAAAAGGSPAAIVAVPLVLLWLLAPLVARQISLAAPAAAAEPLSPDDSLALRLTARRTWRFFETFVGVQDNHLPPDNFQEDPKPVVAHRTSPTNIGLYLLSVVTARDFGWIGTTEAVERIERTMATLSRLPVFRGHFYNWYATQDLRPLDPRYVSSVDSGNLAGDLLALAQACREMAEKPVSPGRSLAGIRDAAALARIHAGLEGAGRTQTVTSRDLLEAIDLLTSKAAVVPIDHDEWRVVLDELAVLADTIADIARTLAVEDATRGPALSWSEAVRACVASHERDIVLIGGEGPERLAGLEPLAVRLDVLAQQAARLFRAMDFGFLFDPTRKLFSIGYRPDDSALDESYYDLLASEARLTSFIAIAKGDVPPTHWFTLGRAMVPIEDGAALLSWSGSMFEYLMPALVMRSPPGSLLDQTYRLVVRKQMSYAAEKGVPWGLSESAFHVRDLELTYQYSNFGVPGLGLKRGLGDGLVISPYATALAAMVDAHAAVRNFEELSAIGAIGEYGFYEAIDYTASRLPEGTKFVVVRAYMAHHQGMSIVAIGNALLAGAMRTRFHAETAVRATELLLQERTPRDVAVARLPVERSGSSRVSEIVAPVLRVFTSPHDPTPRTHLLSNGRYFVMITAAGSGYSRCQHLAVTRWREDVTRDCYGTWVFLRDGESGEVWSAGYQPSGAEPDSYEAAFSEDRVDIRRRDGSLTTHLEILVSPEDDAEVRRVSITNTGARPREIELTSYAEIVLAPPAADAAHPAFSNLFVQTEYPEAGVLLATRRPRSASEARPWAAHIVAAEADTVGGIQYETDRGRFLGRGRGIRTPMSVIDGRPLSNTAGSVLDPIVSLRRRVRIEPGRTARVIFSTLVATTREEALMLGDKYRDPGTFERAVTLAWTQAQVQLHHLGVEPDEAHLFQRIANRLLYSDPSLRPAAEVLERNVSGPPALWTHGISGDLPIVLVRIDETADREIVRQLLRAHEYWRMKGLQVDLVILNERPTSYQQDLQGSLETLVRTSQTRYRHEGHAAHGGVFVLRGDLVTPAERDVLHAAARAVLLSRHGTLSEQVVRTLNAEPGAGPARRRVRARAAAEAAPKHPELEFFNGLGGFSLGGREYVTVLGEGQWTPAPWVNVISNESFGFLVSESGSGFTWSVNSRENQISRWSNDPVSDPPSETFYVRDLDSGEVWGPTVLPIREEAWPYVARHGQGYSRFEHKSHGIALDLLMFVPEKDPLKISRLRLDNQSGRTRRLSITAYVEWVLGPASSGSGPFIRTSMDPETNAMFARNPWNGEFGTRVAFADMAGKHTDWTGDRTEFIGRNGTLDHPASVEKGLVLSGRVGAGMDPCCALQMEVELEPGGRAEVVFFLGQAESETAARLLVQRWRQADLVAKLRAVATRWDDVLGALHVKTPDRSMDLLLNRWLLYQTLSCRVWARAGFYQAGGAIGFRDQLQDVMALVVSRRDIARRQLLVAAARQFVEGDVQHWWHPPTGRGVRTKISDDLLWLPFVACQYVKVTGDRGVLDEVVPFIEGPPLEPGHKDGYFEPKVSEQSATLFEHCARTLDRSLALGVHGLPLMGSGDWNDGMDRVGHDGKGESVWLGWFLHATLTRFAPVAEERGEHVRAQLWLAHAAKLVEGLEAAWDGDWYRRAYFDDGTPLGTAAATECRIDSIAQSWAVISGAADKGRATRAMAAVEEYLVRRGDGLVLLFTPPFDRNPLDPGYVKGYLPGVRENGGQYTHAAIWALIAFAELGDGDRAGDLFSILNPINHGSTRSGAHRYKVEPYVAAADIYSEPPHVGRGGWTWYTGSAGWMYRAGVEWILGFRLEGSRLRIDPCIPRAWRRYEIDFRYHGSNYSILVENPRGVTRGVTLLEVDGVGVDPAVGIGMVDDGAEHRVKVVLG